MFNLLKSKFSKVRSALARTSLAKGIRNLLIGKIGDEQIEQLEELLYQADLGVATIQTLCNTVRKLPADTPPDAIIKALEKELLSILERHPNTLAPAPSVIMIVGVNGNGKTTSCAKLAKLFHDSGEKVLIAASDTFRAAAIEQLQMWSDRIGVPLIKHQHGADPAAVAYDAVQASHKYDRVLIDTAGRLHTKTHLMEELAKIRRSCDKVSPGSPHETLLVLDATTGQNAIEQAKIFHTYTPITGVILTKLDGTARGGIVVPIQEQLGVPVKFIGTGEGMDDLQPFNPQQFVEALFE